MFWKLVALIVPLGLDTFAVAAALAIAGLPKRERLRVSVLFTAFEAGMPVVGLLVGAAVGRAIGQVAEYAAIAALILLGAYMLWPRDEEGEEERLALLGRTHGVAVLGLGLSISLDELAIGFTLGLLQLPVVLVLLWIAVQAFVVAQVGLRLGAHVGEAVREGAERLAGVVLVALGIVLLIEKLIEPVRLSKGA
jgi:manganese efflux pump family protein